MHIIYYWDAQDSKAQLVELLDRIKAAKAEQSKV